MHINYQYTTEISPINEIIKTDIKKIYYKSFFYFDKTLHKLIACIVAFLSRADIATTLSRKYKKKNTHKERWKIIKCCCMVGRSRTGFICHCRIFIARNKKFNRSNHSDSTDLFVRTFGHLAKSPFRRFLIKYQSCIDKLSSSRRSFLKNRI